MVSAKKYVEMVEKIIGKYGTILSPAMKKDILSVADWVLGFAAATGKDATTNDKTMYMKRGANLMKRYVERYETDKKDMDEKLLQCRHALLKGVNIPSWCTEDTKDKLLKFGINLDVFTSEFIGCADEANDFFLNALKKTAKFLGDDYVKISGDLELVCIHLKILQLKR